MESKTKRVGPAKDKHSPIREQLVKSTRDVVDTWHAENKTFGSEALHALRMLLASLGFSLDRVNLVLEILASGQGSVQDIVEELVSYACRNPIRQLHNAVTNLAIEHINIKYIGLSFIVEADSLLEELWQNDNFDTELLPVLHFFAQCDEYLSHLKVISSVQVVFFECHADTIVCPKKRLLRRLLADYVKECGLEHYTFSHYLSQEWEDFQKQYVASFILLSPHKRVAAFAALCTLKFEVCVLGIVTFEENKMIAKRAFVKPEVSTFILLYISMTAEKPIASHGGNPLVLHEKHGKDARSQLYIGVALEWLRDSREDLEMALVLFLHMVALDVIPLERHAATRYSITLFSRCFLLDEPVEKTRAFVNTFCDRAARILNAPENAICLSPAQICNLFDGRLLAKLLTILHCDEFDPEQGFGLETALDCEVRELFNLFYSEMKKLSEPLSECELKVVMEDLLNAKQDIKLPRGKSDSLPDDSNAVIESPLYTLFHNEQGKATMDIPKNDPFEESKLLKAGDAMIKTYNLDLNKIFNENEHWHTDKVLDPAVFKLVSEERNLAKIALTWADIDLRVVLIVDSYCRLFILKRIVDYIILPSGDIKLTEFVFHSVREKEKCRDQMKTKKGLQEPFIESIKSSEQMRTAAYLNDLFKRKLSFSKFDQNVSTADYADSLGVNPDEFPLKPQDKKKTKKGKTEAEANDTDPHDEYWFEWPNTSKPSPPKTTTTTTTTTPATPTDEASGEEYEDWEDMVGESGITAEVVTAEAASATNTEETKEIVAEKPGNETSGKDREKKRRKVSDKPEDSEDDDVSEEGPSYDPVHSRRIQSILNSAVKGKVQETLKNAGRNDKFGKIFEYQLEYAKHQDKKTKPEHAVFELLEKKLFVWRELGKRDYDKTVCFDIILHVATLELTERQKKTLVSALNELGLSDFRLFQLQDAGHMFTHESVEMDPRVSFPPDSWQKELLDVVDKKGSALVVAPTSSGKTFISYYCMKTVLDASFDDVVVFVCPTKALVNQIAAEIYGRFSARNKQLARKNIKSKNQSVFGMFTADYRFKANKCQILVTVPACLQILLLSPTKSNQEWRKRIKYVIFDEIHNLGTDGGDTWERIMLLINCPFVGLSATIGNAENFGEWLMILNGVSERHRGKSGAFKLINYPYRYTDLKLYRCLTSERLPSLKCLLEETKKVPVLSDHLELIHPILNDNPDLQSLTLTSHQSVGLFNALKSVSAALSPAFNETLTSLDPKIYFDAKRFTITRQSMQDYERDIKQFLSTLKSAAPHIVAQVVSELNGPYWNIPQGRDSLYQLLGLLKARKMLPCIVFCFSVSEVERAALLLSTELTKMHGQACRRGTISRGESGLDPDGNPIITTTNLYDTYYDTFSFGPGVPFSNKKKISGGKYDEMLRRGIGVHHAAINKTVRVTVEEGLRSKKLGVVFATGTLAQGLHMPCKTVIFYHDSLFLTKINFLQMSGRAGRRGIDDSGSIIFYDIPRERVSEIMASKLTDMQGHFPLNVSFVLGVFSLFHATAPGPTASESEITEKNKQAREILRMTGRVLKNSYFLHLSPEKRVQVESFWEYSIDYLRHEAYLNSRGNAIGLTGIVTHLFWCEPYNLIFVTLIKTGAFERLCHNYSDRDILALLTYLFMPTRVPIEDWQSERLKNAILKPAPDFIKEAMDYHNAKASRYFIKYLQRVAQKLTASTQHQLPLAHVAFPAKTQTSPPAAAKSVLGLLWSSATPYLIKSPFVALSGVGDDYSASVREIMATARPGIPRDSKLAPIDFYRDRHMNSFLYDFYCHGDSKRLEIENDIRSLLFDHLNRFHLALSAIAQAFHHFFKDPVTGKPADNIMVKTVQNILDKWNVKYFNETRK